MSPGQPITDRLIHYTKNRSEPAIFISPLPIKAIDETAAASAAATVGRGGQVRGRVRRPVQVLGRGSNHIGHRRIRRLGREENDAVARG